MEVIAEINTPASFETFAESLNTGHGIIGTTHADDVRTLVNRVVEQGLPPYLLQELDLVVFPRHVDGDRYVGEVIEFLDEQSVRNLDPERSDCEKMTKGESTIYWNTVATRERDGGFRFAYRHPRLGDDERAVDTQVFDRLADRSDRPREEVEDEFHRKRRYVEYLTREGVTDFDALFSFLADLRTDEAATVERASWLAGQARAGSGRAAYDPDIDVTVGEEGDVRGDD